MIDTKHRRGWDFWGVQAPGWLLFVYLVIAQGLTAISYDLGVAMGTQESAGTITEVGTAFYYGFAFGDLVIYIPILLVGLIGHFRRTGWGSMALAAALGITVYWPIVCLAAVVDVRDAAGWLIADETPFWIVLPLITLWGLWALLALFRGARAADRLS